MAWNWTRCRIKRWLFHEINLHSFKLEIENLFGYCEEENFRDKLAYAP